MTWWLEPPWSLKPRMLERIQCLDIEVDHESPKATAFMALVANQTKKQLVREREQLIEKLDHLNEEPTIGDLFDFLGQPQKLREKISRGDLFFEQQLVDYLASSHTPVIPHESSSHTDGKRVWLTDYGTQVENVATLLHEGGHVAFGSLEPVPTKLLAPLKEDLPPRDFLSIGEVFSSLPAVRGLWIVIEEFRINHLVSARILQNDRYLGVLNNLWQELTLDRLLPSPINVPIFLEQIEGFGYRLDFLCELKHQIQKTPTGRVYQSLQRKILSRIRQGADFSRDQLISEIVRHLKKMNKKGEMALSSPSPSGVSGVSGTLEKELPEHRVLSADLSQEESHNTNQTEPTQRKEVGRYNEVSIFKPGDDVIFVDEVIEEKLRKNACEIKTARWVPFFKPVLPAHIEAVPLVMPARPSLSRRGNPTSRGLHRAVSRVQAGLPSQPWQKKRSPKNNNPLAATTQNTCILDLTTSMCAQRPGFGHTPLEIALGVASMLHDKGITSKTYGAIDGGRKMNHLYEPNHPKDLHEIGAGGFRLGPLIRLVGKNPGPRKLLTLSDSAFGQYVLPGFETMHPVNRGFKHIWDRNCRTCDIRKACCIDPHNTVESSQTKGGLVVWYESRDEHVYRDVADALASNRHVEVFCFVLERKSEAIRTSYKNLSTNHRNIRFSELYDSEHLADHVRKIQEFFTR